MNGKYTNALPLKRPSKTHKINGINLTSNTMANWVIKSTSLYLSLIYDSKIIHTNETLVKVIRINGSKIPSGKKTYMWFYRNRPLRGTYPIVLYAWQSSHSADHPRKFLQSFSSAVVTDRYRSIISLEKSDRILKLPAAGFMPEDLLLIS